MADHDLRATQALVEYDTRIDHDLRATQALVEYDTRIDHDLRVTQVIVEYDWLAPEEESTVAPLAFMHLQRQRRER